MRAFVSGATGKVGHAVALALVERGCDVVALVRDPGRAHALVPPGVGMVRGDVIRPSTLAPALEGCELVFNAMGMPEQWTRDERIFERVNARGSAALVAAAVRAGVRRVVHTSTIDVFHAAPGAEFDETELAGYRKGTAYERSKQLAEELVLKAVDRTGTDLVIVNPAAVYGPGPGGDATSLEHGLLRPVVQSKRAELPLLPPGGMGLVHCTGLARGQLLAADHGAPGRRYILCDGHMSFRDMARSARRLAGRGSVPPVMPVPLARAVSAAGERVARVSGRPPLLPRGQLYFFLWDARPRSDRAQRELGWQPTPLEDGLRAAVAELG